MREEREPEPQTGSLAEQWAAAVVALGGSAEIAGPSGQELAARYETPTRWYHSAEHARRVAASAAEIVRALDCSELEGHLVAAAALAHDVVYDGLAGADEAASAQFAEQALLAAGVAGAHAAEVARLVRTTSTHVVDADDRTGQALVDADLAVLGADPDSYDGYVRSVRQEYAHVDDELWTLGRTAVLTALLDRPSLYVTGPARSWERQARLNLARELASLRT